MDVLGLPRDEAAHTYQDVAEEAALSGAGNAEEGVPLHMLLEELDIDLEDLEMLDTIAFAIATAREKLQQAEGGEEPPAGEEEAINPQALDLALDKVVRELDHTQRPAEDAWAI